jgi:rRNA maturation protein Nop10
MPEPKIPSSSCPICGGNVYEPTVMSRTDGTSNDGWYRCTSCRRYTVSVRAGEPHVPVYARPYRTR